MPIARKETVNDGSVGIYHCISRCVRQAFLCGQDAYTGNSYEHRKAWIKNRLKQLADAFAIDVFAYAVMSNHLHVVIRNRPDVAEKWTDEEVARQWLKVFPGVVKSKDDEEINNKVNLLTSNAERITVLRERLSSVSWFMRCLNEHVARQANREDECKGRFWEGRFTCQSLLDETAVLTCMAYVDLNPVRAGIADTPETSHFTSVQDRIMSRQNDEKSADWLAQFMDTTEPRKIPALDIRLDEYLNLVDWTGRQLRQNGKGRMPEDMAPILSRLSIDVDSWVNTVHGYGSLFHRTVGRMDSMAKAAKAAGLGWLGGIKNCARAFSPA